MWDPWRLTVKSSSEVPDRSIPSANDFRRSFAKRPKSDGDTVTNSSSSSFSATNPATSDGPPSVSKTRKPSARSRARRPPSGIVLDPSTRTRVVDGTRVSLASPAGVVTVTASRPGGWGGGVQGSRPRDENQRRSGAQAETASGLGKEPRCCRVDGIRIPQVPRCLAKRAGTDDDRVGASTQQPHDESIGFTASTDDPPGLAGCRKGDHAIDGGYEIREQTRGTEAQPAPVRRRQGRGKIELGKASTLVKSVEGCFESTRA